MNTRITKQTTIKPTGSGVANMGKGKALPKLAMKQTVTKMPSYEDMPRLALKRTAVTLGSGPTKAKMLPEVTVKATKIKSANPSKRDKAIKAKAMSLNYKNK